jgi:hypothetical protein
MVINATITEKSEIALIQLRRAIQLFNNGDFICSITLAGAAEEILGKLALNRRGYNALDGDLNFFDDLSQMLKKKKPTKENVFSVLNRVRNELKHHNSDLNKHIEADFEFEAQCLIDRAIRNYWIAYDKPPKDRIINNYVHWAWT